MQLTPDEIADLGRWYFIQFIDKQTVEASSSLSALP